MSSALDLFHPLVAEWFSGTLGEPTDIQSQAWPCIAQGKHVFVTAPTGSGKTLTAFLHAINNLIVEAGAADKPPRRGVRGSQVLYISPLKALNNDIERNLNSPLFQLSRLFSERGLPFPQIQVMVRSGDTPQNDRRRMLRSPPQILITTPESLNVLLTTDGGRRVLADVRTVILDEIHNTAGSKRGTYLMTAVERLACEFGEFQRIALSATVRPLEATARFVAGYRLIHSPGGSPRFEPRPIEILAAPHTKAYDVRVAFPEGAGRQTDAEGWWSALVAGFRRIVSNNRSTIFFTNSRRMSEKVTRLMNEGLEKDIAYAHHGSLSREIRLAVEERLKSGELPAIVATSSLELGIDIGEVDQVVLVQTPTEPSSAIQRIGRAGHGVGQVSRGTFHPIHKRDFIDAAVALQCVLERSLEEVRIPRAPLDVLAQVVLAMCLERSRPADELYAIVRTCSAYHELERRSFDLVIDMLTGRYADRRIRELRPRLVRDGAGGELRSLAAVRSLIYMSGGVIPDRGYFNLRTADSKEKVGELDEEFVWERSIGDVFPMGNHLWRIVQITHNDVEVAPANRSPVTVPFWRADEQNRGFFFSEKVGAFLERAAAQLDSPPFLTELANGGLDEGAALSIVDFLKDQRTESGMGLPHRHRVTVEVYGGARGQKGQQTVIHTFWGGKVNRPFSLLIAASLEMETGARVAVFHNKDSVLVNSRDEFQLELVLRSIAPERILSMLREKLESTAFFGALFRQNAQRALLIPRRGFKQRMPLWLSRVRAKRLFDAVSTATDFPILAETWQECLSSEFELGTLVGLLEELADGRIAVEQRRVERPSPLARELIWQETNDLMYANDAPEATVRSLLDDELVRAAAAELGEKWIIPEETVDLLRGHLERTASGYAPADWPDLLSHLDERQWVPRTEWLRLLQAVRAEQGEEAATAMLEALSSRVVWHNAMSGAEQALATGPSGPGWGTVTRAALAQVSAVLSLFQSRPSAERVLRFLAQWAAAPVRIEAQTLVEAFHLEAGIAERLLSEASAAGLLQKASFGPAGVPGLLVPENLERLLRLRRTARRVQSSVLELDRLPLFLARLHGMSREEPGPAADPGTGELQAAMEALFAFPGHAELWESEYLPARCGSYKSTDLDELLRDSGLLWCGFGNRRVRFVLEDDMDLLEEPEAVGPPPAPQVEDRLAQGGRFTLGDLMDSGFSSEEATGQLWAGVWAGRVSCDGFGALRQGLATGFRAVSRGAGRVRFDRWKSSRPFGEHWFLLRRGDPGDALARLERDRERARLLLLRHGILFRELLQKESPGFRGAGIFRALRLMELSGEVMAGRFFAGISGWQFASARAARILAEWEDGDCVWWQNATDPVACTGPRYAAFQDSLPARLPGTRMVYRGHRLVLVARRNGLHLDFHEDPDVWAPADLTPFFLHLLASAAGRRALVVETVNAEPARGCAYEELLLSVGFRPDMNRLVLREYRPAG